MGLLTDEYLPGKWAKLPCCMVGNHRGGRLPDYAVRKLDGRRDELGNSFTLFYYPALVDRIIRLWPHIGSVLVINITDGTTGEFLFHHMFEAGGTVPYSLIIGVVEVALGIIANPTRRTHTGSIGRGGAISCDFHDPSTPLGLCIERTCQAERDKHIALWVGRGPKCIFMVVPGQAPGSGDGFHPIGPIVPITVNHSANLLAVGVVEGSILPVHPQRFMQTFKVGRPGNLG